MHIHVSAIIRSKKGKATALKALLSTLVNDSRNEKACLQYDLFQCIDNENLFIIQEEWLERSWFNLHIQQQHVNDFLQASEKCLERKVEFQLIEKLI